MKSDKGVTLIALAITVVVMLILVTTIAYNGTDEIKDSQKKSFVTELKMIREKVDLYADKGSKEYENIGKVITEPDARLTVDELNRLKKMIKLTDITKYRYMDQEEYKKLGLEEIKGNTIVNFETREVISIKGVNIDNQSYYTLGQLENEKYMPKYSEDTGGGPTTSGGGLPVEEPPSEMEQTGNNDLKITAMQNILVIRPSFKDDLMNYENYEYFWRKISGVAPEEVYHTRRTADPEYMIELEYGEKYEIYVIAYASNGSSKKSNVATVVVK